MDEEWQPKRMDQPVHRQRTPRNERHFRRRDWPHIQARDIRFPEENVGSVVPQHAVDLIWVIGKPFADCLH